MKSESTKTKSYIKFFISVVLIAMVAYIGARGLLVGGWKVKSFDESITKGLDLQGGVSVLEEIQGKADQNTLERTKQLLSLRVNKMGVSETTVTKEGENRIRIEIPGIYDAKGVIDQIGKTGELKFVGPDNKVILNGKDVKDASAYINQDNQPTITLKLSPEGGKKFAEATKKFLGQQIDIYMDKDMLTNPKVNDVISNGEAVITGSKTIEEAQRQASIIKAGALPVTVRPVEYRTVGATLGSNALPQSVKAGVIGVGIIFIFMLLFYRVPGLVADIALVLYIVLVLLIYSSIDATLTLPGIAGFILTIGMAVDANVLIFERTKEELRRGKSVKSAIDAGFHRALSSILDSNITTVIAGVVLYYLGSGPVKGFALTLVIGVLVSMFTALTVTRFLLNQIYNMGWLNSPASIGVKEGGKDNA